MIRCDLHIHSIYSDGIHTPDEIAETAVEKSLSCIAVADHDTLDGAAAAETSCKEKGIRLIPASEISSGSDGRTHILSYLPSALSPALRKHFQEICDERKERAEKTIGRLHELGYQVDLDTILSSAENTIGRPHIARELVRQGYYSSVQDVFDRLLGDNGPAFIPLHEQKPEKIIRLIRDADGIPVLAHPALLKLDSDTLESQLRLWIRYGLLGIEVYHPAQRGSYPLYCRLAEKYGLLVTGGSDHHTGSSGKDAIGETASEWNTAESDLARLESLLYRSNRE